MSDTTIGYHNKFTLLLRMLFLGSEGNLGVLETCGAGLQRRGRVRLRVRGPYHII
jgi:hypothetical protein